MYAVHNSIFLVEILRNGEQPDPVSRLSLRTGTHGALAAKPLVLQSNVHGDTYAANKPDLSENLSFEKTCSGLRISAAERLDVKRNCLLNSALSWPTVASVRMR